MSPEHEQEIGTESEGQHSEDLAAEAGSSPEEDSEEGLDLDTAALAAAELAISEGEDTLRELPDELDSEEQGTRPALSPRDLLLRAMLIFNLVLMGVMLLLPAPEATHRPSPSPGEAHTLPPIDPPIDMTGSRLGREQDGPGGKGVPGNETWSEAFLLIGEGRYDEAAESLLRYEKANPMMLEGQKLEIYTLLSTCLFKAGRMEEAAEYRARANNLVARGYLPEDLRNAARKAWNEGRGEEARRYFARFLLQQKQLSPSLRESVAEAYLRIGDSYRMAADGGVVEGDR